MNKRGLFGPLIMIALLVLIIWVWVIILPTAVTPSISSTLETSASAEHADGISFFLRMIPWAVPVIIVLGFLWLGVTK